MLLRNVFAFAAATLLWATSAAAWDPEVVGLDDTPRAHVTFAAVDGATLVTPELVGSGGVEAIAPKDTRSGEAIARHCACK